MERLLEQIRLWRDQLLNLTRRNRLLYYRPTRASTLVLREPSMEALLRRLDKDTRLGWGFFIPGSEGDEDLELDLGDSSTSSASDVRADDELLTHFSEAAPLARALRNLDRRASQEYLDKGIWILYLGLGMLVWKDQDEEVRSPLILKPVLVTRETPRSPYRLTAMEAEVVVNPSLATKMEGDFGLELRDLEDGTADEILEYVDATRQRVRKRGMEVLDDCVVSAFSFHKEAMYRDLKDNEDAIAANEVIRALALGHEAETGLGFESLAEERLDEVFPPETAVAILDADATQQQCLAAAAHGNTFVMDGPPGTGKSQTIANMIAGALHRGASVLFVSEKAAALEVVASRLAAAGLDEYVLELHSHKTRRKEFAAGLARSLTTRPVPPSRLASQRLSRLAAIRSELNEYAVAMNERRDPLGMSVHQVLGRVGALNHLAGVPISKEMDATLSADRLGAILSSAGTLSRAWGPVVRGDDFEWRGCSAEAGDQVTIQEISRDLEAARLALESLVAEAETAADLVEYEVPRDATTCARIVATLRLAADAPARWHAPWLIDRRAEEALARVRSLAGASSRRREAIDAIEKQLGSGWRDTDPGVRNELAHSTETASVLEPRCKVEPSLDSPSLGEIVQACSRCRAGLDSIVEHIDRLGDGFDLAARDLPIRSLRRVASLGRMIGMRPAPDMRWMDPLTLAAAHEAAVELGARVGAYRELESALDMYFSARVLAIDDLRDLVARFSTRHTGIRKLFPAYRADKRIVAMASRTGRATKDVISRLPEALRWQASRDAVRGAERSRAGVLGEYYHGTDTDFATLSLALKNADALHGARPDFIGSAALGAQFALQGRAAVDVKDASTVVADTLDEVEAWLSSVPCDGSWQELSVPGASGWLAQLEERVQSVRSVLEGLNAVVGRSLSLAEAFVALDLIREVRRRERAFEETAIGDRDLLGATYDLWRSDWVELSAALEWARRLLQTAPVPVTAHFADLIADGLIDPGPLGLALEVWEEGIALVERHFVPSRQPEVADILNGAFREAAALIETLSASTDDIEEWVVHRDNRATLETDGLGAVIDYGEENTLPPTDVVGAVERSVLQGWLEGVIKADRRIKKLQRTERDALVEDFRSIDRELGRHAVAEIIRACNARRPTQTLGGAGLIRTEGQKKRKHRPIRTLLADARDVIQALKPCFMMSPLSVSQFLDPEMRFDLVIFDEASQVQPADAVNCIYRGRQVVIAGDQKQLPPTTFFAATATFDDSDDWSEDQFDDFESVLDIAKAGGLEALPLRWHYRSRNEALITFSNYSFYDGKLVTYPGPDEATDSVGVELFHVHGVYRRGASRDNPIEAEKVVERVFHHARMYPQRTLGVVAFSEAQASLIEHVLDRRRRDHPELDAFFEGDRLSGFFVKNLENVQGDERDTMLFSLGYGPDEFGKFTLNLGPLNRPGGERRLNVAITRARERVEVVSSVRASDFGGGSNSPGVRLLAQYLDYAERGVAALAHEIGASGLDAESPFEEEVIRVIRSWGYGVQPQVGSAGYRIDIGVKATPGAGRFVLGVECDGAQYHSSRVARDRDRLRQGVLEGLGWTIHRIWGPAWYRRRKSEEQRLREAIQLALAQADASRARSAPPAMLLPKVSTREVDLDGRPDWVVGYVVARPKLRRGIDLGSPESTQSVMQAIEAVVEVEGPVSSEVVLERLKASAGVARAGRRIREVFDSAVDALRKRGAISVDRGGFLWSRETTEPEAVRTPTDTDPTTIRRVVDVPPQELRLAVLHLLADALTAEQDELTTAAARLFGWNRRGSDIGRALDRAVSHLIRDGLVSRDGGLLRVISGST